jgi:hypothetical protein
LHSVLQLRAAAELSVVDGQNSIAAVEPTKMPDSAGPIMAAIEVRLTLFPSS